MRTGLSDQGVEIGEGADLGGIVDSYVGGLDENSAAEYGMVDDSIQTEARMGKLQGKQNEKLKRSKEEQDKALASKKGGEDFLREKGYAKQDAYNLAQTGVDAARLAQAMQQINAGKQQREDAKKPSLNLREVSPELKNSYQRALAETGRGFSDAERSAMQQDDLSKYSNALKSTGALGSGQAGLSGVGAQALYGSSLKSNLDRVKADAELRGRNNAYADQAGQSLAADKASLANQQLQFGYAPALEEYHRQLGEAGITERQGRVNMDKLMSTSPYRIGNMVDDYYGRSVYRGDQSASDFNQARANERANLRSAPNRIASGVKNAGNNIVGGAQGLLERLRGQGQNNTAVNPNYKWDDTPLGRARRQPVNIQTGNPFPQEMPVTGPTPTLPSNWNPVNIQTGSPFPQEMPVTGPIGTIPPNRSTNPNYQVGSPSLDQFKDQFSPFLLPNQGL
jgi:hypothetical protein